MIFVDYQLNMANTPKTESINWSSWNKYAQTIKPILDSRTGSYHTCIKCTEFHQTLKLCLLERKQDRMGGLARSPCNAHVLLFDQKQIQNCKLRTNWNKKVKVVVEKQVLVVCFVLQLLVFILGPQLKIDFLGLNSWFMLYTKLIKPKGGANSIVFSSEGTTCQKKKVGKEPSNKRAYDS